MANISKPIKLPKDTQGVEYYPATTTDAVVHPTIRKSVTEIIDDINTSGVPIVDSVDDLNPNAPQGSLTSVAVNEMIDIVKTFSIKEISVHNETYPEVINELNVSVPETFTEENITVLFSLPELTDVETNNHISISTNYDEVGDGSVINKLSATITTTEETTILTLIDSEGVLNEESVETLNSTIENWGGVVLYGVKGETDITEPTEDQYGVLDSFFGYDYTVQEQGDNYTNLYIKEQNEWVRRNDVKIVDSVDKLDPNAEQGSLASVAVNTNTEVPFSELYQPSSGEVNVGAGVVDTTNLSRVSGITINSSYDTSATVVPFYIHLIDINLQQGNIAQYIALDRGGFGRLIDATTFDVLQSFSLFTLNDDGSVTINNDGLDDINNILSSTEFVYGGTVNPMSGAIIDPSYADRFYKTTLRYSETDLYIKYSEGWKVFDEELKNEVSNLSGVVNDLQVDVESIQNTIDNFTVNSVEELDPNAEPGSLASIVSFATVPLSEDYEYGKTLTEKLRIIFPSHVDFSIMNGAASKAFFITRTSINPMVNVYSHIAIEVKLVDTTYTISWGTSPVQGVTIGLEVYAEYDLNGDLLSSQENVPDLGELKYKTTYLDLSEEELLFLDNFVILSEKKSEGTIFIKNSSGWEQYSELVDGSVTTEKVADGAITMDKLSQEVLDAINDSSSDTPGESTGSTIEIVNDLTTGGTDKALSAEMGKTLKETIDAIPVIDENDFISVETLNDALKDYSKSDHTHDNYITSSSLESTLSDYSKSNHTHDNYITSSSLESTLSDYSKSNHTHDNYVTSSSLESTLSDYSETDHTHDDKYMAITKQFNGTSGNISITDMTPNRLYRYVNGGCSAITVNSLSSVTEGNYNEYMLEFEAGDDCIFTWPETLKWMNEQEPTFESGKIYQISIVNNLGVYAKF